MPTIPMNVFYSGIKTRIPQNTGGNSGGTSGGSTGGNTGGNNTITTSNVYGAFKSQTPIAVLSSVTGWTSIPVISDTSTNTELFEAQSGGVLCKEDGYVVCSASLTFTQINPGVEASIRIKSSNNQIAGTTTSTVGLDATSIEVSCSGVFKITANTLLTVEAAKEDSSANIAVSNFTLTYITGNTSSGSSGGTGATVDEVIEKLRQMSSSQVYDFVQTYNNARSNG